ncbi:hypothetical protein LEP1GSC062_4558 [Leptospira alexanderi serovar Manhao 3 str. L 60]|uniref:Uncharacterized protein n=1 Tax=Leptospira alexanderi serovar Manhao 3 str. L 60 TaxID=1049759 RepID=V6IFA4_9LEPT|nr:hypothetical protein LEP1GSC062_4558 [Leptospira alexanderi serovar Manhao 3 str. L 60]
MKNDTFPEIQSVSLSSFIDYTTSIWDIRSFYIIRIYVSSSA